MYNRGADYTFENVKFDTFVELNNWVKQQDFKPGVTLRYNGTTTCGYVEIDISAGYGSKKEEVLKKASEIFKFL